ncbi:MAG TPA: hypothetical protein VF711_13965 [Acidimicrobiales bacterium]
MDLPPWVNAADPPADHADDVPGRLTSIENRLVSLDERFNSLEKSVREAVAKDVEAVASDLRHTVSELGRLLVRDLGRLSKLLAEHRDTIVAEVRGETPPSGRSAPKVHSPVASPSPPPLVDIEKPQVTSIPVADGSDAADHEGDVPAGGGWRPNRRRRRDT